MATKDELIDEVATLKAQLAAMGAGPVHEPAGTPTPVGLWLEKNSLTVDMVEGEALLCDADGLPVDGVIFDGEYTAGGEGLDMMPQDAAGVDLVAGDLYRVELIPRQEGGATFKLHAVEAPDAATEALAKDGIGALGAAVANGEETYVYVEGEGFARVSDGMTIPLERWKVDNGDGTYSDPVEGKRYEVVSSGVLRELQPGEASDLERRVEELEADRLRAGTTIDELREVNAALERQLRGATSLHGSIDDLKPVV